MKIRFPYINANMTQNRSIRGKILLGFGIIFFLIALFSTVSILSVRKIDKNAGLIKNIAYSHALYLIELENLVKQVAGHVSSSIDSGYYIEMEKAKNIKKILDEKIAEADVLFTDQDDILKAVHRLKPRIDEFVQFGDTLVRIILEQRWAEVAAAQKKFYARQDEILASLTEIKALGVRRLDNSITDISSLTKSTFYITTVIMFITLLSGIYLAYFTGYQIVRPIQKLMSIMKEAEGGNFGIRADLKRNDEMGSLATGFNNMLERIQKRDTELELHRNHLEEMVAQRTIELGNTNEQLRQELKERKRAEEALQKSEKRYRMLFESAGDAIFILEAEGEKAGTIVAANKTAAEMHGYTVDELTQLSIKDIDTPETARNSPRVISRILNGEWVKAEEMSHRRKNGEVFPVEVSAGLLELGDHRYILAFDRDIAERKSAEQKLQQYATELKQSNEDVLSFAYIVSHDLRAPLVSIKGFAGELQHALQDIESVFDRCMPHLSEKERTQLATTYRKDVPEAMDFIKSSVGRMDGLINAVLLLSRMGHRELKPEPIDMTEVVKPILSSLAHQIEKRKTVVTLGELPTITADKLSMEQIMGNLLDNALKYLDPGRDGLIAVNAENKGEEIVFHVSDNGRGIAQEDMHKVFELFRRAGKQDVPGEGMGLAYVKTLVRRLGGRIWCESEPGKGTTFSFTIPDRAELPGVNAS